MKIIPSTLVSLFLALEAVLHTHNVRVSILVSVFCSLSTQSKKCKTIAAPYRIIPRIPSQVHYLNRMVHIGDTECLLNLRMDRNAFGRLCHLLKELGGLRDGKYVVVEEQVAQFLGILAHHKKNKVVGFNFQRSGQTVSHYLHVVLRAVLKLHSRFLVTPTPVLEDSNDSRWKWFPGCIGALDGTYIHVHVNNNDKPRYRNRKGEISTNTLAACDRSLKFTYLLPGWEGSAADGRVLRDAINRPNGLRVPRGCFYLCDNAYANCEGFLTPYKGVRYHLKEWGPDAIQPQNAEEIFNMRHTKARNVIERAFRVLKMRWGILRSASFYPIKIQTRLIMACFLLHNFVRNEMAVDPIEMELAEDLLEEDQPLADDVDDYIDLVQPTNAWTIKRAELAENMWMLFQK